ncbi:ABC transporter permease [Ekhidna sp. MALMAid0563]|uniref:ABC transporter permease n=1 Tax=Ekhidna sp. MALMAid0563 TaxID=3143937 RepID=UPI0032E015C1
MQRNYLTIAIRNLWKHKLFTGLNIFGLSLSMSICLVLILLVYDHFQYDRFHPNGDTTYRITTYTEGQEGLFDEAYATSSLPFKKHLIDNYSFVKTATNLNGDFRGEIRSPHKILNIQSLYADKDFFKVFGFKLDEGDPSTALADPYSVILSHELANKLFPNGSAFGKTIEFEDHGSYKITGITSKIEDNTHLEFEALASFATIPILAEKEILSDRYDDWENIWDNYNYLVLNTLDDRAKTEQIINELAKANLEIPEDRPNRVFRLQALNEIVPGRIMSNEISFTLPWFLLAFFGLLGFIVLVTASINYTNLSIAKSLSRAKEIGIRKVNGASRRQIISQFLTESILTALISLIVSIIIYRYLINVFNEIWIFNQIGVSLKDSLGTYGYFILFTIILGLFTGIGPALFLSKIKAINSLKSSFTSNPSKRRSIVGFITGKRTLISIQFCLSILMLVTILILHKQANFLVNANYGFNESEVFYVNTHDHDPELVKSHYEKLTGVEQVSFASHHPAIGRSHGNRARWKEDQEPITLYHFSVDPNYVELMGLQLVAGNNFTKQASDENEKFLIINETAVKTYGFESSSQAIGETLLLDTFGLTILGVVKDYHWEPLMKSIRPMGLRIQPERYEYAYLKIKSNSLIKEAKRLENAWMEFDPAREFEGGFLNEQLDEFYQYLYDLGNILTYVAMIALSITGLGFLGMVSFELKSKVKEIGIRKVLGASFRSLILSMGKSFFVMITISSVIAVPFAMWLNGLWVNQMAFHAPIDHSIFIPTLFIVGSIALATILSQVWINSNKNPTETLRSE